MKLFILNRAPNYSKAPPFTPMHPHSLPSTPTYIYAFLTQFYSFPAFPHPLPLMFSSLLHILDPPLTMCRLSQPFSVHIQILISNPTHHLRLQLIFNPYIYGPIYFTYMCVYVSLRFRCPCAYAIHFYVLYCLCLYTLYAFVCVHTSGLFACTALF